MIKIKLVNPDRGRNRECFRYFLQYHDLFSSIGIQFVDSVHSSYDYIFLGFEDFVDRKLPLDESIKKGIQSVNSLSSNDVYLFDPSDSTSLLGTYDVLVRTKAKALFKPQILSREEYSEITPFNKWWFVDDEIEVEQFGYNITEEQYSKIQLTGWNLGYHSPHYKDTLEVENKSFDVIGCFQFNHAKNYDHHIRNDTFYNKHRYSAHQVLNKMKLSSKYPFRIFTNRIPFTEYMEKLYMSKYTVSPFGMGEICYRDFECIRFGTILIKPQMDKVITKPDYFKPWETYIPCKADFSDLKEVVEDCIINYPKYSDISRNAQKTLRELYTSENLVKHWYDIIKNFDGVE